MFIKAYKQTLEVISRKPIRLWGLSLLSGIITTLASFSLMFIPLLSMAATNVISCGMAKVYLDGLEGKEVNSDQLFEGFQRFLRVAGGMLWTSLWLIIWGLVPIAGFILAFIKGYQYRFVPYILMTQPEVTATQALRLSMELTKGKRLQMFFADLVFYLGIFVAVLVLSAFASIPYIGVLFMLVLVVFLILVVMFQGIFRGLYNAAFYTMPIEVVAPRVYTAPEAGCKFCSNCGSKNNEDSNFCISCGNPLK